MFVLCFSVVDIVVAVVVVVAVIGVVALVVIPERLEERSWVIELTVVFMGMIKKFVNHFLCK